MSIGGESSGLDERISHYEQVMDDLKIECTKAELVLDRLKRQRREIERLLESKDVRGLIKNEVKATIDNISKSMDKEKIAATIVILDKTYPNGWRSGDSVCDGMTIILINGFRELGTTFMGV